MKQLYNYTFFILFLQINQYQVFGQNLPSLLSGKNINATFSILAYDEKTQEWGIAVATNNIYVGNSTIYIEPGLGAFSVIAETHPPYAYNGFSQLKAGKNIEEAILFTQKQDQEAHYRQVSGLDKNGNVFAFTGEALKYWNGIAAHQLGDQYVVMGNQLDESVLESMANTFENTKGTLAERLLTSLIAGQVAGGQISGKQSAALVVKGLNHEWYNQIDLRVDHSKEPFKELRNLLNYHYGRIRLNQSMYALEKYGNKTRAQEKLKEAESLLEGWNGMYGKIALVHSLLDNEQQSVRWIQKALLENPNWKVNLPAFYYLHQHQELSQIIKPQNFNLKNWENAIAMLIRLGRQDEAIQLTEDTFAKEMESSYLHYLLGKSFHKKGEQTRAISELKKALEMDQENVEARLLLVELVNK